MQTWSEPVTGVSVSRRIDSPPAAGSRHRWLLTAALQLRRLGVSEEETARVLNEGLRRAGRAPQRGEIENTLRTAARTIGQASSLRNWRTPLPSSPPRWPKPEQTLIAKADKIGAGCADLWEMSPMRFETPQPAEIARILFPPSALLCVGKTIFAPVVEPLAELLPRISAFQHVVPSPMRSPLGTTAEGKPSPRTLTNVGARRFAVVEWDDGSDPDAQSSRIAYLTRWGGAELVLAMLSGGKSVHAWFDVRDRSENDVRAFFTFAARLGADVAGFSPIQWARLPDGTRDNGKLQSLLFLSPPCHR